MLQAQPLCDQHHAIEPYGFCELAVGVEVAVAVVAGDGVTVTGALDADLVRTAFAGLEGEQREVGGREAAQRFVARRRVRVAAADDVDLDAALATASLEVIAPFAASTRRGMPSTKARYSL